MRNNNARPRPSVPRAPSRGDVRAQEHAALGFAKLEKRRRPPLLLLLPVNVAHRDVDVIQKLRVVLLQERKQKKKPLLARDDAVALLDARRRGHRARVVDADVRGGLQRQTRQVLHLGRLRRGEEHRLSVLRDHLHDRPHLFLEPDVEHPIRLVHAEDLQRRKREPLRVLHVIEKPPGRRDEQVDALDELLRLRAAVRAADDQPVRLRVFRHELLRDVVNLQRELSGSFHTSECRGGVQRRQLELKGVDGGD
eukprot:31518-Pelagococcus_subviridis.AAC.16